MRANAWEGIGKELQIKLKFYVSSRDVRIVCPRLNAHHLQHSTLQEHVTTLYLSLCWTFNPIIHPLKVV